MTRVENNGTRSYLKFAPEASMADTHVRNAKYPHKRIDAMTDRRRYAHSISDDKNCTPS